MPIYLLEFISSGEEGFGTVQRGLDQAYWEGCPMLSCRRDWNVSFLAFSFSGKRSWSRKCRRERWTVCINSMISEWLRVGGLSEDWGSVVEAAGSQINSCRGWWTWVGRLKVRFTTTEITSSCMWGAGTTRRVTWFNNLPFPQSINKLNGERK